jgi:signal transduction histidine kinase
VRLLTGPLLCLLTLLSQTALAFIHAADSKPEWNITLLQKRDGDHWQRVTSDRQARLENISPGRYRLLVLSEGTPKASIEFSVAPLWYQTYWCAAVVFAIFGSLALLLYQLRLKAMHVTIHQGLDERTRMARELHDTFLQTVQGSKMVADDALAEAWNEERCRGALQKISGYLSQAATEGRAALQALRAPADEQHHVSDSLRRALGELATPHISSDIQTIGLPKELKPLVRDELLHVGFEAIRNAFTHSEAAHIHVTLSYAADVTLNVSDDGIGIPEDYMTHGRQGHFGLIGMRERVDRIGGRLVISLRRTGGTQVSVTVPGAVAYRHAREDAVRKLVTRLFKCGSTLPN